ncbi:MAG TPA: hypothetical protein VIS99_15450 [Terrimicrobiaceae bacterium]
MNSKPRDDLVKRTIRRVQDRWHALRVVKWLSEHEDIVWISTIAPTPKAKQAGLPKLEAYRGLRAIAETKDGSGAIQWQFLWATRCAADRHESRISNDFASTAATRTAVCTVEIRKKRFWTSRFFGEAS